MTRFILMNKNKTYVEFMCNIDKIEIIREINNMPEYIKDTEYFIGQRANLISRANVIKLAKSINVNNIESLMRATKSISLTDTFWVKTLNDKIKWEDVNPYNKRILTTISDMLIHNNYYVPNVKSLTPEFATDGSFKKCWRSSGDTHVLVKCGTQKAYNGHDIGTEPVSEYIVAYIEKQLGFKSYVDYSLDTYGTYEGCNKEQIENLVSCCERFTTENIGFINMGNINTANKCNKMQLMSFMRRYDSEMIFREIENQTPTPFISVTLCTDFRNMVKKSKIDGTINPYYKELKKVQTKTYRLVTDYEKRVHNNLPSTNTNSLLSKLKSFDLK